MKGMTAGNFIREIVESDLRSGKHSRIVTRFPPEPNGYLHIGHAKSICLNFGLALEHGGVCHLRFDDTNPSTESVEYAEAIQADVRWLGFDWGDRMFYASGYFGQLYEYAVQLITKGKAYVDSLSAEEIRQYRGTLTEPGKNSPYRNRSVEESLDLFARMRAGEFKDGAHVLRAKIDMASPNVNMRDPTMYRIRHVAHYRTGDQWCIYPTYDYAHPISDAIEGITHSLCTLEFEDHRPLYDWFLENVSVPSHPQQIEFARLNLTHTVMSKRRLLELVGMGKRKAPFSRVLYIERDDFREVAPKKFFRLVPGQEVRLRYAYIIKCVGVVKDERTGEVVELRCTYDPETRTGGPQAGRKVKGTIHWVSAAHALDAEVRLYDHLFVKADAGDIPEGQDYTVNLNPNSLERLTGCRVEPSLAGAQPGSRYQFERQGYFCVDPDSAAGQLVFNRTVALRDSWAKIEKAQQDG